SVHSDLAQVLPVKRASPDWLAETADVMCRRLDAATAVVPALAEHADRLRASYHAIRELPGPIPLQRVHGDLHLGQALRTAQRGPVPLCGGGAPPPARPGPTRDRRARDGPGSPGLCDRPTLSLRLAEPVDPQLEFRAAEWADRNRDAFCDGYSEVSGVDPR